MGKYTRYFIYAFFAIVIFEILFFLNIWVDGYCFTDINATDTLTIWAAVITLVFLTFSVMGLLNIDGRIKELSEMKDRLGETDQKMREELLSIKSSASKERQNIIDQAETEIKKLVNLSATRQNLYDRLSNISSRLSPDERVNMYTEFLRENANVEGINYAYVHICRGDAYMSMDLKDKALTDYEKAREITPNNELPYVSLGCYYVNLKDYPKSIEYFQKAIELKPNYASLYMNVANSYAAMGKYEKAKEFFDLAFDINPNIADAYYNMARYIKDSQEDKQGALAETMYKHCLKLNPLFYKARINLAMIYRDRNDNLAAREELNKLLTEGINNDWVMAILQRGICNLLLGNTTIALIDFQHVYHLAPHNVQNMANLAKTNLLLGHLIEAKQFALIGLKEGADQGNHNYDGDFNDVLSSIE